MTAGKAKKGGSEGILSLSRERVQREVLLDADVAKVFISPEAVNNLLRALITALPTQPEQ